MESIQTTCMILFLVAGSTMLGHTVIKLQVSQDLIRLIESYALPSWGFVAAVMLLLVVLGCIYIVLPIILPALAGC